MASKRKDIDTPETEMVSKPHKRNSQTPIQVDDSKLSQDTVLQTPIQDEDRKVLGGSSNSTSEGCSIYYVVQGDTGYGIASKLGISFSTLEEWMQS